MGFSIPHLLVVLGIVMVVFGTKRLGSFGSDLGSAIMGFKKAMKEGDTAEINKINLEADEANPKNNAA